MQSLAVGFLCAGAYTSCSLSVPNFMHCVKHRMLRQNVKYTTDSLWYFICTSFSSQFFFGHSLPNDCSRTKADKPHPLIRKSKRPRVAASRRKWWWIYVWLSECHRIRICGRTFQVDTCSNMKCTIIKSIFVHGICCFANIKCEYNYLIISHEYCIKVH